MEGFCITGLGGLYLAGLIFGILQYFNISHNLVSVLAI